MTKPSYLGLLDAIAATETANESLFLAWAGKTKDRRLAKTLRFVAVREGEHGKAFAKRMLELGYEVRPPADDGGKALGIVESEKSDLQKFRALKLGKPSGKSDIFDPMFADKTIDPATGGLLGRYIAEERDSLRLLAAEFERLKAKDRAKAQATS